MRLLIRTGKIKHKIVPLDYAPDSFRYEISLQEVERIKNLPKHGNRWRTKKRKVKQS